MTAAAQAPAQVTLGDGTTAAGRARSRWRSARFPLITLGVLVLAALASWLVRPTTSA
ncbi:MAG: DUF4350 domain-containing protein, partial [Cellulomonadaceae bacterium]|nr:DUF4350 domain-containing protein [Cellulomonadaceae bacterium]